MMGIKEGEKGWPSCVALFRAFQIAHRTRLKFEEVEDWRKAWKGGGWRAKAEQVPKRCLMDSLLAPQNTTKRLAYQT